MAPMSKAARSADQPSPGEILHLGLLNRRGGGCDTKHSSVSIERCGRCVRAGLRRCICTCVCTGSCICKCVCMRMRAGVAICILARAREPCATIIMGSSSRPCVPTCVCVCISAAFRVYMRGRAHLGMRWRMQAHPTKNEATHGQCGV